MWSLLAHVTLSLPKIPSDEVSRGQPPLVAVVQPTDFRHRHYLPGIASLSGTRIGWVLTEREMRPRLVVIPHVAAEDSQHVSLVECDNVIEAFPA